MAGGAYQCSEACAENGAKGGASDSAFVGRLRRGSVPDLLRGVPSAGCILVLKLREGLSFFRKHRDTWAGWRRYRTTAKSQDCGKPDRYCETSHASSPPAAQTSILRGRPPKSSI